MTKSEKNNIDKDILKEYIKPRKFNTKFWLSLIILVVLVVMVFIFKSGIIDQSIDVEELKSSIQTFAISSQWIVKERIKDDDFEGIILVPQISFRIRNTGRSDLKYVFFLGVFRFLDTGKTIGEGFKMVCQKPLEPDQPSREIVLISQFGYRASSESAFRKNPQDWRNTFVEIYVKSRNSKLVFLKSFYISKKIKGMSIDVKIS